MELHNDEVPASEVWAVVIENPFSKDVAWFITSSAATDNYRVIVEWHEGFSGQFPDLFMGTTISRWYVELPRQRMDRDDVDIFVEGALEGLIEGYTPRRLDFRSFSLPRKAVG